MVAVSKRPRMDAEVYTMNVRGKKNLEILMKIRDSLEMCDMVPSSDRERFTQQRRQSEYVFQYYQYCHLLISHFDNHLPTPACSSHTFNFHSAGTNTNSALHVVVCDKYVYGMCVIVHSKNNRREDTPYRSIQKLGVVSTIFEDTIFIINNRHCEHNSNKKLSR